MKTEDHKHSLTVNKVAIEAAQSALRMLCGGLGSVSEVERLEITKPLAELGIRMARELEEFDPWNRTDEGTPPDGEVVLIHVTSLGEHGYVTAWFDIAEGQWVGLDDKVAYDSEEAPLWTYEYPKVPNNE